MNFHIITLFPGAFDSYLGESIVKRAIEDGTIAVYFYNPRDYSDDKKWRRIDQKPYSGGPGMVIQALPTVKAIEAALARVKRKKDAKAKIIWFSPGGAQFDTAYAKKAAQKFTDIILVSGRYEGIDARVKKIFKMDDISVGPFVLTGGELPAMIMIDCIARQVEGVLGNFNSLEESRVSSHDVYTRPEVFTHKAKFDKSGKALPKEKIKSKKYAVPKVLLSGDHKKIEEWKKNINLA
jgi:tRNA (guanine37-N1)-methyltransferase